MSEGEHGLVSRYLALVDDVSTPTLDEAILLAAKRQSSRRRFSRCVGGAFFVTALAAFAIGTAWHARPSGADRTSTTTEYGRNEGSTRTYLLNPALARYSGSGSAEGIP
jgi:hypothetical protein